MATDRLRSVPATVINVHQNAAAPVDMTHSSSPDAADVLRQSPAKSRKRSATDRQAIDNLLYEVLY
jgi:hypothetical protein